MKRRNATAGTRVQHKTTGRVGDILERSHRIRGVVVSFDADPERDRPVTAEHVPLEELRTLTERTVEAAGVQLLPSPDGLLCTLGNRGPAPMVLYDAAGLPVLTVLPGQTVQCPTGWAVPTEVTTSTVAVAGTHGPDWAAQVLAEAENGRAVGALLAERARFADALQLLGWHGCSHFTGDWSCRRLGSGKIRGSHYGHNDWCEACIALDALNVPSMARPAKDGTYPEPPDRANYQPTPED